MSKIMVVRKRAEHNAQEWSREEYPLWLTDILALLVEIDRLQGKTK